MKTWQHYLIGFLSGLAVVAIILLLGQPSRGEPIQLVTFTPNLTPAPTRTASLIQVHILGAVQTPGVYSLTEGARVADGLQAAGGSDPQADLTRLNLARVLEDGERLYVPPQSTAEQSSTSSYKGNEIIPLININTASASELEALPQIGETKAAAIFEYRSLHGPFVSLEDLLLVPGIGQSILNAIRDLITLGP